MKNFNEELKKFMLAGIGAVATTCEKAQALVDGFVKKGELTVEQGKVLNEELRHRMQDETTQKAEPLSSQEEPAATAQTDAQQLLRQAEKLTPAQRKALLEQLTALDKTDA